MLKHLQCIDPFLTISERQPAAGPADGVQVAPTDSNRDPLQNLSPGTNLPFGHSKSPDHLSILELHRLFEAGPFETATIRMAMRTRGANEIGLGNHLDGGIRIVREAAMNRLHVFDKRGAIPLSSKTLQTKESMTSNNQRMLCRMIRHEESLFFKKKIVKSLVIEKL